jgi:hypothetical protein
MIDEKEILGKIEEIKKISLDIMSQYNIIGGKIELNCNTARQTAQFKIIKTETISGENEKKIITVYNF